MGGRKSSLSGVLLMLLMTSNAWGWGQVGHRASAHIAQAYLTPHSQSIVRELTQNRPLADISTWADQLRSSKDFKHTASYHFEGVPAGVSYLDHLRRLPRDKVEQGGVLQGVLVAERQLENPQSTRAEQEAALRFLVHFIADLHQPMHSGRPEDRGGNAIRVNWFGYSGTLHSVWDTGILLEGHADIFKGRFENDQSLLYARRLMDRYRGRYPHESTRDNPGAWLMESIQSREPAYDRDYEQNQVRYLEKFLETADARVYLAGLRTADVLNRIFANVPAPHSQQDLVKAIESIIGRLEQIITLGPRQSSRPTEDWH